MTGDLTPEIVRLAYQLFLDRDAENDDVVDDKLQRLTTLGQLKHEFLESIEFRVKHPALVAKPLSGNEPPMAIEQVSSDADLQRLFVHIQETWQQFGETEPHFSVLTSDEFLSSGIGEAKNDFYESGRADVERIINTLRRNGIDPASLRSCIEYGCGVGRVTPWLARQFGTVVAFDISSAHLRMAEQHASSVGIDNATFSHVVAMGDLERLPTVDFLYSVMVLQHNPPPLIEVIVRRFLAALGPGGVALFQVPTYRLGYSFSLDEYLRGLGSMREMEMHPLPQQRVFEIVANGGAEVVEVLDDGWAGVTLHEVSNSFLVRKR